MTAAIALFARAPVPGRVKTRLLGPLTAEQACDLHRKFVRAAWQMLSAFRDAAVFLYTDEDHPEWRALAGDRLRVQQGPDLGRRMLHCFEELHAAGFSPLLIVGSDSPALTAATLAPWTAVLAEHPAVIGPAEDGGYYAIGCRAPHPEMFAGVKGSSEHTLAQTVAALERCGMSPGFLLPCYDVDTPEDLARFQARPVFADLELARRLDRAEAHAAAKFVEARAKVCPQSGAEWIEVAGAYAMYDGPSSPVTQTFGLGLFDPITPAELDRIERFFQDRGAPVFHDVCPLSGIPLAAMLSERGYQPVEFSSVMYRSLGQQPAPSQNDRIRVRLVREHEKHLWVQIAARGWSDFPELTGFLLDTAPVVTAREDSLSFIAELEGEPIAAGVLCAGGGVALLAGACTVPEGRNQGAQRALLDARLRCGAEHGCDIAMICAAAGSASQRNAERHGFRIAYTRTKWGLVQHIA